MDSDEEAWMKVLYATDGGAPAMQALAFLERVAAPEKVQVTAVTVVGGRVGEMVEDEGLRPATEIVQSAVTKLKEAGIVAEMRMLRGEPGPTILKEIAEGGFELAVLGAGNRSWLGRLLLGSVSTKVLHASPTSMMIVRRISDVASPVQVLFATDGSAYADVALQQMIAFMHPSTCQINVLSVAEHLMSQLSFPIPRVGYATSAPTLELERDWIAAAKELAINAADNLERAGFRTQAQAVLGAPAARVLAEAQNVQADLLVVGSRGLGAVDKAAVGSVSDQLVREAPATFVSRS